MSSNDSQDEEGSIDENTSAITEGRQSSRSRCRSKNVGRNQKAAKYGISQSVPIYSILRDLQDTLPRGGSKGAISFRLKVSTPRQAFTQSHKHTVLPLRRADPRNGPLGNVCVGIAIAFLLTLALLVTLLISIDDTALKRRTNGWLFLQRFFTDKTSEQGAVRTGPFGRFFLSLPLDSRVM